MVKGLDERTEEAAILDAFQQYALVKEIRLVRERGSRISRGFAFVEFESLEGAREVVDQVCARRTALCSISYTDAERY